MPLLVTLGISLSLCILSAFRDVLSDFWLSDSASALSSSGLFFVFVSVCVFLSFLLILQNKKDRAELKAFFEHPSKIFKIIILNAASFLAYFFYFKSLETNLGSGLISFIDYSLIPVAIAFIAWTFFKEDLKPSFFVTLGFCLVGLAIVLLPRTSDLQFNSQDSWLGIFYIFLSVLGSAWVSNLMKILLVNGSSRAIVLFLRFFLVPIFFGIYLLIFAPQNLDGISDRVLPLIGLGVVGFFVPMYFMTFALQRLSLHSFALMTTLIPVSTVILSVMFGLENLMKFDFLGFIVLIFGILYYELGGSFQLISSFFANLNLSVKTENSKNEV
ncbi:MAG: DMT family transporter [Bdellovibrionota bacterium]